MFIGAFCGLSIIKAEGWTAKAARPSAFLLLYHPFYLCFGESGQMHGPLSFFHQTVHHTGITADDVDVLNSGVETLLRSLADCNALNKQAEKFINGGVPLPFRLALKSADNLRNRSLVIRLRTLSS